MVAVFYVKCDWTFADMDFVSASGCDLLQLPFPIFIQLGKFSDCIWWGFLFWVCGCLKLPLILVTHAPCAVGWSKRSDRHVDRSYPLASLALSQISDDSRLFPAAPGGNEVSITNEARLVFNSFVKHKWLLLNGHDFKEYDCLAAGKGNATCCHGQHNGVCLGKDAYLLGRAGARRHR